MRNEHKPETVPTPNKGTGPVASAWKVMENTETETGSNRQLADAGLLGVCIVFLATMLSLSQKQIDTLLTVALVAFAAAIPNASVWIHVRRLQSQARNRFACFKGDTYHCLD